MPTLYDDLNQMGCSQQLSHLDVAETLRLAAKAANVSHKGFTSGQLPEGLVLDMSPLLRVNHVWNPAASLLDASGLEVGLALQTTWSSKCVSVTWRLPDTRTGNCVVYFDAEDFDSKLRAKNLAVTRAAAAIGSQM